MKKILLLALAAAGMITAGAAGAGVSATRTGLEAGTTYYLNASSVAADNRATAQLLFFTDYHQPVFYDFPLPEGSFTAEAIDPWAMTITPIAGTHSGKARLQLPARPYQALRFRRVS